MLCMSIPVWVADVDCGNAFVLEVEAQVDPSLKRKWERRPAVLARAFSEPPLDFERAAHSIAAAHA